MHGQNHIKSLYFHRVTGTLFTILSLCNVIRFLRVLEYRKVSLTVLSKQSQTHWVVYHQVPAFIHGLVKLKCHYFLYF